MSVTKMFLNQVHTGLCRPVHVWFLKINPVWIVSMCVCPPLRLLITSGVIWTPYDWLNKFYSCYIPTVVVIINGRSLGIGTCRRH